MNMNPHSSNKGVRHFILSLLLFLGFVGMWFILFFFIAAYPASASITSVFYSPHPRHENLCAHAEIAKPTDALVPTVLPTNTSVPTVPVATETPASLTMDIVQDTAVPHQVSQDQVN